MLPPFLAFFHFLPSEHRRCEEQHGCLSACGLLLTWHINRNFLASSVTNVSR